MARKKTLIPVELTRDEILGIINLFTLRALSGVMDKEHRSAGKRLGAAMTKFEKNQISKFKREQENGR